MKRIFPESESGSGVASLSLVTFFSLFFSFPLDDDVDAGRLVAITANLRKNEAQTVYS